MDEDGFFFVVDQHLWDARTYTQIHTSLLFAHILHSSPRATATLTNRAFTTNRAERTVEKIEHSSRMSAQLDALRTENQRLKDENGALIRVISKLSK